MVAADKVASIRAKAEVLAGHSLGDNGDALTEMAAQAACAWCNREDIPEEMETVVAALTGVVFFHETLSIWTLLGVGCVLGGVIILAKGDAPCSDTESSTAST